MSRFHNALFLGDAEERVKVLESTNQLSLAYITAATHGLEDTSARYHTHNDLIQYFFFLLFFFLLAHQHFSSLLIFCTPIPPPTPPPRSILIQIKSSILIYNWYKYYYKYRLLELLEAGKVPVPEISENSFLLQPPTPILRGRCEEKLFETLLEFVMLLIVYW